VKLRKLSRTLRTDVRRFPREFAPPVSHISPRTDLVQFRTVDTSVILSMNEEAPGAQFQIIQPD